MFNYLFMLFSQMKNNKKGQGMVEYGLIIGLIAIVVIIALTAMGGGLKTIFEKINTELGNVPVGG